MKANDKIKIDRKLANQSDNLRVTKSKYNAVLKHLGMLERELESALEMKRGFKPVSIRAGATKESEATAFLIASDWHYEERIKPGEVNGLNKYNLSIANRRIRTFFQNSLKLINLTKQDIKIENIVLALLGDFINGSIHEEMVETNLLEPAFAVIEVQNLIAGGIQFLLDNTDMKITIPCCVGNHSRMTPRSRHATETGNSIETLMYHNLAFQFKDEPRVEFNIATGYLLYMKVYGRTIRFMHGQNVRGNQGIGGIDVPLKRGLLQWDKVIRADLTILGHWHQFRDGGHYIINGSIVGFNAFAVAIKADYEEPRQAFFLLDKDRGKTIVAPILVDKH